MVFLLPEYCFVIQSISKCREYQFLVHIFRHFNSKILFLILKTARWITNIMAFIWGGEEITKERLRFSTTFWQKVPIFLLLLPRKYVMIKHYIWESGIFLWPKLPLWDKVSEIHLVLSGWVDKQYKERTYGQGLTPTLHPQKNIYQGYVSDAIKQESYSFFTFFFSFELLWYPWLHAIWFFKFFLRGSLILFNSKA